MTAEATRPRRAVSRRVRSARRTLVSDLLVTALWASGAAAAALFLASGGMTQFSSPAEAVTSIGIVAGLVGSDFILVMLILAARIPLIDRSIGHDRAIRVHRSLGKPALYLLLGHGALLLTGYGMSEGINPVAEIFSMLTLADMPLAFIALGLIITVVITSVVAVRRRFSYEGWHLVHLLSYVAVAFAIPHQFSVGSVLSEGTGERTYWIALYVVALGSILIYRFIMPIVASINHRMTIAEVVTIAPGVTSIHLAGRDLTKLGTVGGQYFVWRFWTRSTWWHSHPISLSAMPTDSAARITVRDLGLGSSSLSAAPVGTRVSIEGPYGLFTDVARAAPNLAIIAAGIGITPVRALLEDAEFAPGEATILLRASDTDETYLWEEVQQIADARGAAHYTMIGPRSPESPQWMTATDAARGVRLISIFPNLANSDLFICGPSAWLDLVEADALATGIPADRIHSERFDW